VFAVGGLRELGFFLDSPYLMVLSDTRGIINCEMGLKVARDYSDYYFEHWDDKTGLVAGFDVLEGEKVQCGGFEHPDILKKKTSDGWSIEIRIEKRPDYRGVLEDAKVMYLMHHGWKQIQEVMVFHYDIDRGYGFSELGDFFVIGTSSDVTIWRKAPKP